MLSATSLRKVALVAIVVVSFVAYSYQQRHSNTNAVAVAPTSKSTTTSSQKSSSSTSTPTTSKATSSYKDGAYTGSVADAFYGNIQVEAVIQGGKITNVEFLQTPHADENSVSVNDQATPILKQEAIQAQSSQVDTVSGATNTSQAFVQSLAAALTQALS
jgi:uncharacterized protein with FMN-binding domain